MKKLSTLLLIALVLTGLLYSCNKKKETGQETIDQKVSGLVQKMSLEEKVGQMTQITITAFIESGNADRPARPIKYNESMLDSAFNVYKIGSILNVPAPDFTREEWLELTSKLQKRALESGAKIPLIYGLDGVHGNNYIYGATLFPQEIGQAATWNPDLVQRAATITAYESKAAGVFWNFSPVLGVARNPLWPRVYETFGEDTYLCSEMGKAVIKGYQGDDMAAPDKLAACLKHYLGYSMPLSGKDRTPAWIPERYLRQYFLPPFAAAVKAGAATVMVNSGEINGIPVHANYHILTEILKQELGFKGFVVTDWQDIEYLYNMHFVAHNNKEAVKMAINAGIDMSMVPNEFSFARALKQLVEDGEVPMSRIDDAVSRILRVKYELGLFDHPLVDGNAYPDFGSSKFADVSYDAAKESITLLKNQNDILPLPKNKKVLVTGYTANSLNVLNGGWTHTWQGDNQDVMYKNKPTIVEAIKSKIGENNVFYTEGVSYDQEININQAVRFASQADYIIACLGEKPYAENVGNINVLDLPEAQLNLVHALAKTGKPVILVMVEGRPRIIREIVPDADGIMMAYLPSYEGGRALADIIFGDANPSGKLPITYPQYANNLVTYDHKFSDEMHVNFKIPEFLPQFEFGTGLSYTSFEYKNLTIVPPTFTNGQPVNVSVEVSNTGEREGKEVVQLYVHDEVASITPAVKKLIKFQKIDLQPGENKTVNFELSNDDFSFIGQDNKPVIEPGKFDILVGGLKQIVVYEQQQN